MKKFRIVAASVALVLGVGGAVSVGVASADAHVPSITATCSGVVLNATAYDGNKSNTWDVNIGGVDQSGTFGATFSQTFAVPQGGASTHVTAKLADADNTPAYTQTIDTTVGPCGTVVVPPRDVPIVPVVVHPATCASPVTYDVKAQDADVKYDINTTTNVRPVVGDGQVLASGDLVISAHVIAADLVENGGKDNPNSYTTTVHGGPALHNASCVPAITCTVTGPAYHESDDDAAVLTQDGYALYNNGDGKPVDQIIPIHTNLQGINDINYTTTHVVGNGIFARLIVDLSADGGSSYNSFSITSNHIGQSSVADVGSKSVFLGKTIAQVADLYPDAVVTGLSFQTGSAYAAGDGATLTGYSGDCGHAGFVPDVPVTTHRTTDTNGSVVCTAGNVGGGSYNETVTNYTTAPVWNSSTHQYDLVETVDAGYPVVTTHTVVASRDQCPVVVTPVAPTVKAVCSANDKVTLATTDGIVYTASDVTKKGETVTATAVSSDTLLAAAKDWTLSEDKTTATYSVAFDNSACPITVVVHNGKLAFTGSDPTGLIFLVIALLVMGGAILFSVRAYNKRRETEEVGL